VKTPAIPGAGGTNIFAQVNQTVANIKSLIQLANQFREAPGADNPPEYKEPPPGPIIETKPAQKQLQEPPSGPPSDPEEVAKVFAALALDMIIKKGMGDKKVSELLELAGPITIKQLRGFIDV